MHLKVLILFFCHLYGILGQNFLIILTDDQDLLLKSLEPLKKIEKHLSSKGTIFTNAYTSSPVCCPSRASILTGSYAHNHQTFNNSKQGGCYSDKWIEKYEAKTFPAILYDNGYTTFYAGKYLNEYYSKSTPYGYHEFFGLHGNSKYFNYTLNVNGKIRHYGDKADDYYTNVIRKQAMDFLNKQTKEKPFLAIVSTPSCHAPFTPEEKYSGTFSNISAPRTDNFNVGAEPFDKHWLMTMKPHKLCENTIKLIDNYYQKRLETLLTVDDLVGDLVELLEERDLINDTFLIFTSDNGYHLGNWAMPWDKRLPYETDINVPLIVRGPNIAHKAVYNNPTLLIDIAPTILNWARISYNKSNLDGIAFDNLINQDSNQIIERQMLIEHFGDGNFDTWNEDCPWRKNQKLFGCSIENECKAQDSWNNSYTCVRHLASDINLTFCKFDYQEEFYEAYDLNADLYQLNNIAFNLLPSIQGRYQIMIDNLRKCNGDECRKIQPV